MIPGTRGLFRILQITFQIVVLSMGRGKALRGLKEAIIPSRGRTSRLISLTMDQTEHKLPRQLPHLLRPRQYSGATAHLTGNVATMMRIMPTVRPVSKGTTRNARDDLKSSQPTAAASTAAARPMTATAMVRPFQAMGASREAKLCAWWELFLFVNPILSFACGHLFSSIWCLAPGVVTWLYKAYPSS
jgi:hypothetical protein